MSKRVNLQIDAGADYSHIVTYRTSTDEIIDIDGWSARMQLRAAIDDDEPALELTSEEDEGLTINGAAGEVTIAITASQTEELESGEYLYDLEIENDSGQVFRLIEGTVTVNPNVTRATEEPEV
jgi:hypothetical protein